MTYLAKPKLHHPTLPSNKLGFTRRDYEGKISTLCAGCGHDSISAAIIQACWEMDVEPHKVAKLSGIGCSSKTPDYFLGNSHGFNTVHGRMPSVLTGANLANRELLYLGVSGDGDSASIGIGQFVHVMRRGVNMVYIVENNGVYGLTKGQFSATADAGSKLKTGVVNDLPAIDLCAMAIELGCAYVARSFSGDMKQLVALLKGALAHRGTALLDVISPCVTFNNHESSTKSYKWAKDHEIPIHEIGFIPYFEDIAVEYDPGTTQDVELHDGSHIRLRKLREDYDPTNKSKAIALCQEAQEKTEFLTGLIYAEPRKKDFLELSGVSGDPLVTIPDSRLRPPREALDEIMEALK
jgi:2-oxoglutarate ferredoxin oxidoreductase subunit beta